MGMADCDSPSDVLFEVIDAAWARVEFNFVGGFGLRMAGDRAGLDLEHLVAARSKPRYRIAAHHRRPQQRTGVTVGPVKVDLRFVGGGALPLERLARNRASSRRQA